MVQAINNTDEFKQVIKDNKIVVVDFHATWCGPCKVIAPKYEFLEQNYGSQAKFIKVDVDECQEVAQESGISAMPTFQLFVSGKKVEQLRGANYKGLKSMIENELKKEYGNDFKPIENDANENEAAGINWSLIIVLMIVVVYMISNWFYPTV